MNMGKDLFFSQQALFTLFSATNKLQMQGDKYLQELTIRQILAIPAIIHAPDGKATINHIARSLGTTKQNAKQIVNVMERKQYISTAPSQKDKRAVDITILPEGEEAFRLCSRRIDELLADVFQDFSTEELEMLWTLLSKLYRFDGAEQDNAKEHAPRHSVDFDELLRHHSYYVKRRTENRA